MEAERSETVDPQWLDGYRSGQLAGMEHALNLLDSFIRDALDSVDRMVEVKDVRFAAQRMVEVDGMQNVRAFLTKHVEWRKEFAQNRREATQ